MTSILKNSKQDEYFHFYVISADLSLDSKKKIARIKNIKDFNLEFISIDGSAFEEFPSYYVPHIPLMGCYRLKMASLAPHVRKAIYLDADLVVTGSLLELWETDLGDNYIAGCADCYSQWLMQRLSVSLVTEYINSGVLLVNLDKWRRDNVEDKFFSNMKKYRDNLSFPDQDILNITFANKIKKLPMKWNFCPSQLDELEAGIAKRLFDLKRPTIIHYAGDSKPWADDNTILREHYFKYAKMVPEVF